jgi:FAD/FMN-containing dehydrogenase
MTAPKHRMPRRWPRRIGLAVLTVLVVLFVLYGKSAFLIARAWVNDRPVPDDLPPGFADDASRLNLTAVREVWDVPADPVEAERQLAALLRRARADGLKVSIAGARHSMGGHTISPDGIVVNMLPFDRTEVDPDAGLLRVGAGARWSQVVPVLNDAGYSVGVMQSNNDFSVGGSLSVNCHGWQHNRPPIASTVHSFRLMNADGEVVRCSRTENAELFSLALGGYGLFGIILEAELRVVPNERYQADVEVVPVERYVARFHEKVDDTAGMVYGRLCVSPDGPYLREAILTVFRKAPCPPADIPPLSADPSALRRAVYRSQIGSPAGKQLRWKAERQLGDGLRKDFVSRNQLLNGGSALYREQNADRTDVLHEYFIPEAQFAEFLDQAGLIIPRHSAADLLNVTVRNVHEDRDTVLRYADQRMFSLVMLFNQERTAAVEAAMEALSRELIGAALACGGRYYLPYRLHATPEQFRRAYPQADTFFAKKRQYDPDELFQNQFYTKYAPAKK